MDQFTFEPDLIVEVTNGCNMSCKGCYAPNVLSSSKKINLKMKNLSSNLLEHNWNFKKKLKIISVRGGEPTLNPEIKEILNFLSEKSDQVFLETNGLWIRDNLDLLETIQENGTIIKLSFDKMHSSNSIAKLSTIETLEHLRINFCIAITASNVDEFQTELKSINSFRKVTNIYWHKKATSIDQLIQPKFGVIDVQGSLKSSVSNKFEKSMGATLSLLLFFILFIFKFEFALAKETHKIVIGLASNFSEASSSSSNPFGNYFSDAIKLALEDRSEKLKLNKIELTTRNFNYGIDQTQVIPVVQEAIKSDIIAMLGYNYSSYALIAAPLHLNGKLPMITPSATANRLNNYSSFIHPTCFDNKFMGVSLAHIASSELKSKRVAIVVATDCAYCQDLASAFRIEFEKTGNSTKTFSVLDSDVNFDSISNEIKSDPKFDAVLVPNHEMTSAKIIYELASKGIKLPYLGGDGWGNVGAEFFGILKSSPVNGFTVSHWHQDDPNIASKKFFKRYQKAFGKAPNDTSVLAYDAMTYLIDVIITDRAFDRTTLERALNRERKFSGITGLSLFNSGKGPRKSLVLLKVKPEKFQYLKTIRPEL